MYLFEHEDFPDLLNQAARQLKLPFAFVEKDYWVTYVLYRLTNETKNDFIFKGGTSLTKGWNLLDRFSEDIDLLFVPHDLSKNQKIKRLKEVKELVSSFEGLNYIPEKSSFPGGGQARVACYSYEIKESASQALLPHIRLEMGYRGGDSPLEEIPIQSYIGKLLEEKGGIDEVNDISAFHVKILDLRRTFVEKLFAIRTAYNKGELVLRCRHYYDVYKLLQREEVASFLDHEDYPPLKQHIIDLSKEFFGVDESEEYLLCNSRAFGNEESLIRTLDFAFRNISDLFFGPIPSTREMLELIGKFRKKF